MQSGYRIVLTEDGEFAIMEVVEAAGRIVSWTREPVRLSAPTLSELRGELVFLTSALRQPILVASGNCLVPLAPKSPENPRVARLIA